MGTASSAALGVFITTLDVSGGCYVPIAGNTPCAPPPKRKKTASSTAKHSGLLPPCVGSHDCFMLPRHSLPPLNELVLPDVEDAQTLSHEEVQARHGVAIGVGRRLAAHASETGVPGLGELVSRKQGTNVSTTSGSITGTTTILFATNEIATVATIAGRVPQPNTHTHSHIS